MNNQHQATAAITLPPPFLFFVCLGTGLLLDYFLPIDIPGIPRTIKMIIGMFFLTASAYFALGALTVMRKNKTPFDPSKETLVIVSKGPFRFSRNPMYLSLLLLMFGVASFTFSLWYFVAVFVLFFLLGPLAVKPEEKYLTEKFGKQYTDYKNRVRRWI
jgi:protein-S-isoprenylcysteine O-methyltransferase Ste14